MTVINISAAGSLGFERENLRKDQEKKEQQNSLVSEYKIGHTTYVVELHFNLHGTETLDDVLSRLMLKDAQTA